MQECVCARARRWASVFSGAGKTLESQPKKEDREGALESLADKIADDERIPIDDMLTKCLTYKGKQFADGQLVEEIELESQESRTNH